MSDDRKGPPEDNGEATPPASEPIVFEGSVSDDVADAKPGVLRDKDASREFPSVGETVEIALRAMRTAGALVTLRKREPGGNHKDLPGCPVIPLGLMAGVYYYLTERSEIAALTPNQHRRNDLVALFGQREDWMWRHFDRPDKDGKPTGVLSEKTLADALMKVCADRGVRDVWNFVRGRGCWLGANYELVMHCGDVVRVGGDERSPGLIHDYAYPAAPPGPRPADETQTCQSDGPGPRLLEIIRAWNWKRPETDPLLLVGWMVAAIVGGALDWRPMIWVTGASETGKSTLFDDILDPILGFKEGVVHSTDPTAAGIHQKMGRASSLPVVIDEAEAKENNRRLQAVIELARQAASGGLVLRGSADHSSAGFVAQSCFAFSSIAVPPLMPQDRSRIAVLELGRLDPATEPPAVTVDDLVPIGAGLRRRLIDHWPRVQDLLGAWRQTMKSAGHGGRGADLYGTLLAMADLVLNDHPPTADDLEPWVERLDATALARRDDIEPEHRESLGHLLTWQLPVHRGGEMKQVAAWIKEAVVEARKAPDLIKDYPDDDTAARVLGNHGLRLHCDENDRSEWLVIANRHQGLNSIFAGTKWHATGGATGGWRQSLLRFDGARTKDRTFRFAGYKARGVLIPLEALDLDLPTRRT